MIFLDRTRTALCCAAIIFSLHAGAQDTTGRWSYHFQLTAISQSHPQFHAPYSGDNSLSSAAEHNKLSLTTTLFVGRKLWQNGAIYVNPEIAGGSGISSAKGIAGFTNGETFRIGSADPKLYIARLYYQHDVPLKHTAYENVASDVNQVAGKLPTSRLTITAGKFCLADFFDDNTYSHDPREQFLNWSLMSNGAWDYPADTRGYTKGVVVEWVQPGWAIRAASVMEPRKANGLELNHHISKVHAETVELEKNWKKKHPGAIRLLMFHNLTQAPSYTNTLAQVKTGDSSSVDIFNGTKEGNTYGGLKYGFGINAEQEITTNCGVFLKASWNDGKTATWAFTEIDRSISGGISIKGESWKRPADIVGVATVFNGISAAHRNYLAAGLYGFIIGDGQVNYGTENITEAYYLAQLNKSFSLSADYQFVNHPAYNKDRGPVHVFAFRAHLSF